MNKIELVIFDFDGVIVDSERISAKMLQEEAAAHGVRLELDYILQNYVGRSYPKVLADMQTRFEVVLPPDFEESYRERLLAAFRGSLKVMTGVEAFIETLDVPFCVATSSSPKRVQTSLDIVGLRPIFEGRVFTSSQVQNGKPAPDLFLFAAREMNVDPPNCLVIEDSVLGVQAGLRAGMNTVRFTGGSHIAQRGDGAGAHHVVTNFESISNIYPNIHGLVKNG